MTLTRAALAERVRQRQSKRTASRNPELLLLVAGALAIASGLYLVYEAKTAAAAPAGTVLNLNEVSSEPELLRLLDAAPDAEFIAGRIYELRRHGVRFDNDGAVARLRVTENELLHTRGLTALTERMSEART